MSVWMTPDLRPFFGGTYFPPEQRLGHPGFASILSQIAAAWKSDRDRIVESAGEVVEQLRIHVSVPGGAQAGALRIDQRLLESGFYVFRRGFDTQLGGFGGAPKFPRPSVLGFLLRYHAATKNQEALEMVLVTLREMAKGGMHDQLGGGFHRYSVDERWRVPHFEKMLYDQAQLATSYLEAFQITGDPQYAAVARGTLDYTLRDMRVLFGRRRRQRHGPGAPARKERGGVLYLARLGDRAAGGPRGRVVRLPLWRGRGGQRDFRSARRIRGLEHPIRSAHGG
jgi:uncharacterized protein YyaL (SSP411 family)